MNEVLIIIGLLIGATGILFIDYNRKLAAILAISGICSAVIGMILYIIKGLG